MSLGRLNESVSNPQRQFHVRTLRRTLHGRSDTVYCLFKPRWMKGISFSLQEQCGQIEPFDIHLLIPYGLNIVRRVDSKRRCQGLLGSDFTYDDLKTWLYEEGQSFRKMGIEVHDDFPCHVIECNTTSEVFSDFATWTRRRTWIDRETSVIRRIDFFSGDSSKPFRTHTLNDYHRIDEVLIQRCMQIQDLQKNHETTIELVRAWHNREVQDGFFEVGSLKKSRRVLEKF